MVIRANRMSYVLTGGMSLGVTFSVSDWLNAGAWQTALVGVAYLAVLLLAATKGTVRAALALIVITWASSLLVQIVKNDSDVSATILVPFALSSGFVGLANAKRITHLARTAPLAFPIVLSALIIPLFTGELWSAMQSTSFAKILLAAAIVLVPLIVAVTSRLRESATNVATPVSLDPEWTTRVAEELAGHADDDSHRDSIISQIRGDLAATVSDQDVSDCSENIVLALRRRMRVTVAASCAVLCGVTAIAILIFAWLLVPSSSVESWIQATVPHQRVDLLGVAFHVPTGIYLKISLLLGILATAVLMASVSVDETHADRFSSAMLEKRVAEAVPFVVAYTQLPAADESTEAEDAAST